MPERSIDSPTVTTFVMGTDLPWPDEARMPVDSGPFEAGAVHRGGAREECRIRKIAPLGATLCGELAGSTGEEVAIELASGQRAGATVAWVERGETGVRFKQPVDVLALINRQLISQPTERRRMPRVEIRCAAHIGFGGSFWPVTLRNISSGGLQVEGDMLPARGTYLSVFLEGLNVPSGEVAWRRGDLAGIRLMEELSWTSIVPWIRATVRDSAG